MPIEEPRLLQYQFAGGGLGAAPPWYAPLQRTATDYLGRLISGGYTAEGDPALRKAGVDVLKGYAADPFTEGFFSQRQAQAEADIGTRAASARAQLMEPWRQRTYGYTPAFLESQQRNISLQASQAASQTLMQNLVAAEGLRREAATGLLGYETEIAGRQERAAQRKSQDIATALGYKPLETGREAFQYLGPNYIAQFGGQMLGGAAGAGLDWALDQLFDRGAGRLAAALGIPAGSAARTAADKWERGEELTQQDWDALQRHIEGRTVEPRPSPIGTELNPSTDLGVPVFNPSALSFTLPTVATLGTLALGPAGVLSYEAPGIVSGITLANGTTLTVGQLAEQMGVPPTVAAETMKGMGAGIFGSGTFGNIMSLALPGLSWFLTAHVLMPDPFKDTKDQIKALDKATDQVFEWADQLYAEVDQLQAAGQLTPEMAYRYAKLLEDVKFAFTPLGVSSFERGPERLNMVAGKLDPRITDLYRQASEGGFKLPEEEIDFPLGARQEPLSIADYNRGIAKGLIDQDTSEYVYDTNTGNYIVPPTFSNYRRTTSPKVGDLFSSPDPSDTDQVFDMGSYWVRWAPYADAWGAKPAVGRVVDVQPKPTTPADVTTSPFTAGTPQQTVTTPTQVAPLPFNPLDPAAYRQPASVLGLPAFNAADPSAYYAALREKIRTDPALAGQYAYAGRNVTGPVFNPGMGVEPFPSRAYGGPVYGGANPFLVGERGPEILTMAPGSRGWVYPQQYAPSPFFG